MPLKPVNKAVYVKPDAPLEKRGQIFMPPSDEAQHCGIVQASDSALCKPGDLIVYTRFFPSTVRGVEIVTVDEKSILGVDDAPEPWEAKTPALVGTSVQPLAGPGLLIAGPRRMQ